MKLSGLKDKNGKDIYFNYNIVKQSKNNYIIIETESWGIVGVVINENFGNILNDGLLLTNHNYRNLSFFHNTNKYIEIVGNIDDDKNWLPNES